MGGIEEKREGVRVGVEGGKREVRSDAEGLEYANGGGDFGDGSGVSSP